MSRDGETLHLFVEEGLRAGVRRQGALPARAASAPAARRRRASAAIDPRARARSAAPINDHAAALPRGRLRHGRGVPDRRAAAGARHLQPVLPRGARDVAGEERHMLESLGQHLGVAIESLRLVSRERELAIAEERNLLAQELHDSIAQSLAFLNLQTQMLRKALAATDAAETARDPGRDPGRRAGVLRRRARAAGALPHPDRRRRRRARHAHAARPASSTRRESRPSSRRAGRRCRSRRTTSCR